MKGLDKKKARKFLEELHALEQKHGISVTSHYEEEIDYDYGESPFVSGIQTFLLLVDTEGNELSVEDVENGYFPCLCCGGMIEGEDDFCNEGCEHVCQERQKAKTHKE